MDFMCHMLKNKQTSEVNTPALIFLTLTYHIWSACLITVYTNFPVLRKDQKTCLLQTH